ncbi:MAG TPA: MoxR family ATPase [Candidatus Binatia bacterium]|jgi:MoxR-like ATPase
MSETRISTDLLDLGRAVQTELQRVICGQAGAIQSLLVAITAGGHVLIEGVPGVAKTLLARSLAAALRCRFSRIQFTPDLMPSDITGVNVFDSAAQQFSFRPGPLFSDIVLADEINRAPAKTQAALLEAMQEYQVSIDGQSRALSPCFTVIATQNPVEYEGTYPLPEAQLDRFLMKVIIDYPGEQDERAMLKTIHALGDKAQHAHDMIQPVLGPEELTRLRAATNAVRIDETVLEYTLRIIRQSRSFASLTLGASPRAAVMLLQAAKALAVLRGNDYITPDEIQIMALPVLRHRVRLTPEAEIEGLTPDSCIESLLAQVDVPR